MKKLSYLTIIALVTSMGTALAQAQNPECMTQLSIYAEHAKVKNYDAAYEPWKMVMTNCPDINKANFTYGERILKFKIENSSGADKDSYERQLLQLFDDSHKYFPKKFSKVDVLTDKVLYKSDNKLASDQQLYDMIKPYFESDLGSFTNPKVLYIYFSSLVNLHEAGSKDLQEVFDVYDDVNIQNANINKGYTDKISALLAKEEAGNISPKEKKNLGIYSRNSELLGKVSGSIDSKLGALADCGNLIPLYQKNFDSRRSDLKWVKRAVGRMYAKECTDEPLFAQMVEVQAELDPSADVYVFLGLLKNKKGDSNGAIADFNKAVELETDPYKKSDLLYKVATILRKSSKSKARQYAQKAIDQNASNGKAYLLIASLYAGSANACGSDAFEKRAMYWKAADLARKAGRVDPSLSGRANKSAASYSAKAPDKTMIFNSGKAGQSIKFNCWVGGSVTVPSI